MKRNLFLISGLILLYSAIVLGQPPLPPGATQVPIDGTAIALIIIGTGLVIRKILSSDEQRLP